MIDPLGNEIVQCASFLLPLRIGYLALFDIRRSIDELQKAIMAREETVARTPPNRVPLLINLSKAVQTRIEWMILNRRGSKNFIV
jgi:hypothetical protein